MMTHRLKSDEQVGDKRLDLSKVIRLLEEDPLTRHLKEEQLFVLKKLLKRNQTGFLLKELADVSRILNMCAEKATDHSEYGSFLCQALNVCRRPFLQEELTDGLHYAEDATEFLSNIAHLMRVPDPEVRGHVLEAVKFFIFPVAPLNQPEGFLPTSPGYRQQLLSHSSVATTLLFSMADLDTQPAVKLQLLQTLQILSSSSGESCASILQQRGAETICLHMNEANTSTQALCCSSEILWNLLEGGNKEEVIAQLSSLECVLSLRETFSSLLENSSHHLELQLRNDLLVITTLIAEASNSVLVESLFAKLLVGLITFPERNEPYCSEELQLKKLLLNLLVVMCRDSAGLQVIREEEVMYHLLNLMEPPLVSPPGTQSRKRHLFVVQQEELQLQALAVLCSIAPVLMDTYMSYRGNSSLLLLLDWSIGPDDYFSQSQGFHGTGGIGGMKAQIGYCIRALRAVMSAGHKSVNQDLLEQNALEKLLGVLIQSEASFNKDVMDVEMMFDLQWILSVLCETDTHIKEKFGSREVQVVVNFLNFSLSVNDSKLILSTVSCVWSCIVGCCTTEDIFLAKNGASLLLSLLGTSPRCNHGIVLSTLLELCDNPNALPQILSWRDAGGHTAPRLLLQLWRDEEKKLGVIRNQHGGIKDPKKPILTSFQQASSSLSFPANAQSPAVLDVSENLRAKIYFILSRLGFQELPGLSDEDYVTLIIVRRYLDFKVWEVCEEISRELVLDGVKLISTDEEGLRSISETSEDAVRSIMKEQTDFLKQQKEEKINEEKLYYNKIMPQDELRAESRTSFHNIQKEKAARRQEYVESTRPKPEDEARPEEDLILSAEQTDSPGIRGLNVKLD